MTYIILDYFPCLNYKTFSSVFFDFRDCEDPFLYLCAHLDPPESSAAVRWAAWAGRGTGCPGPADAGAACDAAGADERGAARPPHACSWEHLHKKDVDNYAYSNL